MLKTWGYLISTLSVVLLGAAAWPGAARETGTLVCLILGMTTSISGMLCRWLTYVREHRRAMRGQGLTRPAWP